MISSEAILTKGRHRYCPRVRCVDPQSELSHSQGYPRAILYNMAIFILAAVGQGCDVEVRRADEVKRAPEIDI